jgi:NADH-quinone oxidoreductase subunit A
MLLDYAPILVLLALVLAFTAGNLDVSRIAGGRRRTFAKASAYECGMEAVGSARVRLSIHFYLTAVLFILFDVEAIFLVLWAAEARSFAAAGVGNFVLVEIAVFVGTLVLALAYVWRKGGLDWDR